MIDFNFNTELRTNRFSRYYNNVYDINNLQSSNILLYNPKLVPMVGVNSDVATRDSLKIANGVQFHGYSLTKDRVLEVFNTAAHPLRTKVGTQFYYIGKGFIGEDVDGIVRPLVVYCFPSYDYSAQIESDLIVLIDSGYSETQGSVIKSVINKIMTEHPGDIIITNKLLKHLSGVIKMPQFASIQEKREFTNQLIERCVATL